MSIVSKAKPTTCSNDPLPSAIVKDNIELLLPAITHLVTLSLHGGEFPEGLKSAIVRPLLKKKGLDLALANYRPVSNLTYISKIIEKAVAILFDAHMDKESLLPKYQSAYRAGFSTETLLLRIHNDILKNMEEKKLQW